MFKCGEKCTGILAADARLVREKVCYATSKKDGDLIGMKRAAAKVRDTESYIKIMEEWPPAVNLAIGPALMVDRLKPVTKRTAVMKQIERVQETAINPMTGKPIGACGVTGTIIEYLIAKHDGRTFARNKQFVLTKDNINAIKYAITVSRENQKAVKFFSSLLS